MEEILRNWKNELKELEQYNMKLVKEYCKTQSASTAKTIAVNKAKIEILKKCINLEKF